MKVIIHLLRFHLTHTHVVQIRQLIQFIYKYYNKVNNKNTYEKQM